MADKSTKARVQPSRLQRRAPASIQVTPVSNWNVAIPLLSPLATSPDAKRNCIDINEEECRRVVNSDNKSVPESEKVPIVCKKWQHPAAPFFYEPAPTLLHSICTGITDRS
ncbi:hypothetical protein L1987_56561 [Smallanthus sonchifolius]|uniref:Uncharacterized protein n=1 Tax=Smallanthus sonchifolius TaxID=185202 RepID=A0ACB9EDR8_9ASTR|nr:hypothetical protein L1987_56561 [Smallanthus sonchifolius]